MGPRVIFRSIVWGLCLAILFFGARSAQAAAPICDETASSRTAPPPVLPIRDVKLEAGSPCDTSPTGNAPVSVAPIGHRAPPNPAVHPDAVANEAWARPVEAKILPSASGRLAALAEASALRKPGFSPGVFRPPRG